MKATHARKPYKGQRELKRSKKHENLEPWKQQKPKVKKKQANERKKMKSTLNKSHNQEVQLSNTKSQQIKNKQKAKTILKNSSTTQSQS